MLLRNINDAMIAARSSALAVSLVSLACLFAVLSCAITSAQAVPKKMWKLEMSHGMKGNVTAIFCPDAVNFTTERGGRYVSQAPKWDIYAFRTDDKIICNVPRDVFIREMNFHQERFVKYRKIGTGSICLYPVTVITDGQNTIHIAAFPGIPRQVCEFICAWLKQPVLDQIALKSRPYLRPNHKVNAMVIDVDNRAANIVETKSVKEIPYDKSVFLVPRGYRTVARLEDTFYSKSRKKDLESIVDDLGIGVDLFKK
ncbi:MAG: hypothetical protein IT343_14455 [Candidatus Melainabacteria bacterium]|nr:hypothetical protein [Candidatus Melainabacteria bacterium]